MSWRTEKKARELRRKQAEEHAAKIDKLVAERKQREKVKIRTADELLAKYYYESLSEQYGGDFTKRVQQYQDHQTEKYRQFEQWSRYEKPYEQRTWGEIKILVEDHTPPEPVPQAEPVPVGKTLDELFEEDDE